MIWLCWIFTTRLRLSLVVMSGSYSVFVVSLWRFLLRGLRGPRAQASVVAAHRLSCPVAHGILPDQEWTVSLCTGRQMLNLWTTREVLYSFIFIVHINIFILLPIYWTVWIWGCQILPTLCWVIFSHPWLNKTLKDAAIFFSISVMTSTSISFFF